MAYKFHVDEPVLTGIQRIVGDQIDKMISEMNDPRLDRDAKIHQVRKRCKKIRGALRLVRPGFEQTYRYENAWFRDAARALSDLRDVDAMIETYDRLMDTLANGDKHDKQMDRRSFGPIRRALTLQQRQIAATGEFDARLQIMVEQMRQARARIAEWKLSHGNGFAVIAAGLKKTYGRGRKAMTKAYRNPNPENFHEWRKRVKYHRYHLRLLNEAWEPVMRARWNQAKQLSDLLGDEHDLSVLKQTLLADEGQFHINASSKEVFVNLLEGQRTQLRCSAKPLGQQLFAEKPKRLSQRLYEYWQAQGELAC